MDRQGHLVTPITYSGIRGSSEGLYGVRKKGLWGYMDAAGKIVIQPQFEDAGWFSEGLAPVQLGGKIGFIDKAGSWVISPRFTTTFSQSINNIDFFEGFAAVPQNGLWGFINKKGDWVVPPIFKNVERVVDGLSAVEVMGSESIVSAGYIQISKECTDELSE